MNGAEKCTAAFLLIFVLIFAYAYGTGGINSTIINAPVTTPVPSGATPAPSPSYPPLPNTTDYNYGVNYQGKNWHFTEVNSTILNRDFTYFQNANMNQITFPVYWSVMETANGSWNSPQYVALHNWVDLANTYGLKVIIDFHTLSVGTSYTIPLWISSSRNLDYNTVVTYRDDWLNFVNYTSLYLNDVDIDSYQLVNEPLLSALGCTLGTFIDFVNDTKIQVLANDSVNITLRFNVPIISSSSYNYNATLLNLLDYVSINWYLQFGITRTGSWAGAMNEISTCLNALSGYDVFMSEFGDNRISDTIQYNNVRDTLTEFSGHNNVIGGCAWWWKPNAPISYCGYNLVQDNGTPRPAFNLLTSANT